MKQKIKVLRKNKNLPLPEIIKKGEWVDLRSSETVYFNVPRATTLKQASRKIIFDTKLIKLGVAMELPKGFEAVMVVRSSTPKLNVFQTNAQAVIDNSFKGDNDEWRLWLTALDEVIINEGNRICQFRIQLSQKATFWQKFKWLLSSGIKIVEVDSLNNKGRGGIGTTGKN